MVETNLNSETKLQTENMISKNASVNLQNSNNANNVSKENTEVDKSSTVKKMPHYYANQKFTYENSPKFFIVEKRINQFKIANAMKLQNTEENFSHSFESTPHPIQLPNIETENNRPNYISNSKRLFFSARRAGHDLLRFS